MKKILIFLLLTTLYLVSCGSQNIPAADNYFLLKKADEERALGNLHTARSYYRDYIRTHPLTNDTSRMRSSLQDRQFFLRNLLIAYDRLFDILGEDKQLAQVVHLAGKNHRHISTRYLSFEKQMHSGESAVRK
jgi:hypothetical protein